MGAYLTWKRADSVSPYKKNKFDRKLLYKKDAFQIWLNNYLLKEKHHIKLI